MKRIGADNESPLRVQASVELNENNINTYGMIINPLAAIVEEHEELQTFEETAITLDHAKKDDNNSSQEPAAIYNEGDLLDTSSIVENVYNEDIQIELKSLRNYPDNFELDEPGYISYEDAAKDFEGDMPSINVANLKHSYSQPNLQVTFNEVVGSLKGFMSWTIDRVKAINSTEEIKDEINRAREYVGEIAASSPKQLLTFYENIVGAENVLSDASSEPIKASFYGDLVDINTTPYVSGIIKENQILVDGATVIEINDLSSHTPDDEECKSNEHDNNQDDGAGNIKLKRWKAT